MAEKFSLTAQLRLQAPTNTRQVLTQMRRDLRGFDVEIKAKGSAQAAKEIQKVNNNLSQATGTANQFANALKLSITRAAGLAVATRVVSAITTRFNAAVAAAVEFERELIKVSQVTGVALRDLKGLTDEITRLSTSLGVSSNALVGVSRQLSQAGFSARDLQVALSALAKTELAATFDDISQTTEGAIAIFNQFGAGAAALEGQLGAINAVAGSFAVEAGDLIGVVRRVGGVFKSAGGDLNELIALFTSVRSTTRESAESIATGLRTIFTRIQRPSTIKFLENLGLELTTLDGRFVGPIKAVEELNKAFAELPAGDTRFIQIAEELGGFRQIGKVIPLIQQYAVAQEALKVAQEGSNSLTKDAETAQQSLAVQFQKVREEYSALVRDFTASPVFQLAAGFALKFASALVKVLEVLNDIGPVIASLGALAIGGRLFGGGGGLLGGLLGGGVTRRNQGGPIGFNRGGVVPGSGNTDTVPAMLTPGEFVIRKSSVGKIGTQTLAAMNENRFNSGGLVEDALANDKVIGAAVLESIPTRTNTGINPKAPQKRKIRDLGAKFQDLDTKQVELALSNFSLVRAGVNQATNDNFFEAFQGGMDDTLNASLTALSADLQGNSEPISQAESDRFANAIRRTGVVGQMFEFALDGLTSRAFDTDVNRPFDFPNGLGEGLKDNFSSLPNKFVDAKVSSSESEPARMLGKITDQAVSELDTDAVLRDRFKKQEVKANSGGAISGEDTVPALLTPGEFVLNKKAAGRIGAANLNTMNKKGVVGFNKGGAVGRIQRLRDGGFPDDDFEAGLDIEDDFDTFVVSRPDTKSNKEGAEAFIRQLELESVDVYEDLKAQAEELSDPLESMAEAAEAAAEALEEAAEAAADSAAESETPKRRGRIREAFSSAGRFANRVAPNISGRISRGLSANPNNKSVEQLEKDAQKAAGRLQALGVASLGLATASVFARDKLGEYGDVTADSIDAINGSITSFVALKSIADQVGDTLGPAAGRLAQGAARAGAAFTLVSGAVSAYVNTIDKQTEAAVKELDLNNAIASAKKAELTATLGQVGAATAAGAAFGSLFGPIGTIVGGLVGLAIGLQTMGDLSKQSAREVKAIQGVISGNLTNVDKNFKDFNEGNIKAGEAFTKASASLAKADAAARQIDDPTKRKEARDSVAEKEASLAAEIIGPTANSLEEVTSKTKNFSKAAQDAAVAAFKVAAANRTLIKSTLDAAKIQGATAAASTAVQNVVNSFTAGNSKLQASFNTLETSISNFGDPAAGEQAVKDIGNNINSFFADVGIQGTSTDQAIQRSLSSASAANQFSSLFQERFTDNDPLTAANQAGQVRDRVESLLGDIGDENLSGVVRANLDEAIKAATDDTGNVDISKVFTNISEATSGLLDPLNGFGQALIEHQNVINKLTVDRRAAEEKLIQAQTKAIDIQLEAAKVIEGAGGARLTTQDQLSARTEQFNLRAGDAGVSGLRSGSAADINRVGNEIFRRSAAQQAQVRSGQGIGIDEDRRAELQKANEGLIQFSRQRIQLIQEELKVIKKRNELEKSAIDALLSGDAEAFFEQQGASAAASAIRNGNTALLRSLDASDVAKGLKSLEGTVSSAELFAGARAAGLSDRQAQILSGTTPEEQALNNELIDTAGALQQQGAIGASLERLNVATAEMVIQQANITFQQTIGQEVARQNAIDTGAFAQQQAAAEKLANGADSLANKIDSIPDRIEIAATAPFNINLNANGIQGMEGAIGDLVNARVKDAIRGMKQNGDGSFVPGDIARTA